MQTNETELRGLVIELKATVEDLLHCMRLADWEGDPIAIAARATIDKVAYKITKIS